MRPNAQFIQDALDEIGRLRGGGQDDSFRRHITLRLEQGAREYGESYHTRQIEEFAREIREEAADIATWGILGVERAFDLDRDGELEPERAAEARMSLLRWAAIAQWLHRDIEDFLDPPHA